MRHAGLNPQPGVSSGALSFIFQSFFVCCFGGRFLLFSSHQREFRGIPGIRYGMAWYCMVCHGMVRHSMVWYLLYGMLCMVLRSMLFMVWYDMVWYGRMGVWTGISLYGVVWYIYGRFFLQRLKPPLTIVAPGRVYRRETPDSNPQPGVPSGAFSSVSFFSFVHAYIHAGISLWYQLQGYPCEHPPRLFPVRGFQIEILRVQKAGELHLGHLKGTVDFFLKKMFGPDVQTRYRGSFFPFTEPSMEVDIWFKGK